MSEPLALDPDLEAAAAAYAVRCEILEAIAELAASPLDRRAAARMRAALEAADTAQVQAALGRLSHTPASPFPAGRRHLQAVPDTGDAQALQAPQLAHPRLPSGGIA